VEDLIFGGLIRTSQQNPLNPCSLFEINQALAFVSLFACPKSNQKGHHEHQPPT
jgi:hypothetical protein